MRIVGLPSALAALLVALALMSPGARGDDGRAVAYAAETPPHTVISRSPPDGRHGLPVGRVTITPTSIPAGDPSQRIEVMLELSRAVRSGRFAVRLPARWISSAAGSRLMRAARLGRPATAAGKLAIHSRTAVVTLAGAPAGAEVGIALERLDPPAGTYSLALLWGSGRGRPTMAGRARIVVLGRTQLPTVHARMRPPGLGVRAAGTLESYNDGSDPGVASDPFGNLWLSFVAFASDRFGDPIGNSRIVVNRVGVGATGFQALNTGLPRRGDSSFQDKSMISADTSPGSPHFGRLYIVWNEDSPEGQNTVLSFCDTVVSSVANPGGCDEPNNWTAPVPVTDSGGSHIAADVAAAPNGDVYVVWWDYSAANRIEGDVCRAGADCSHSSGWGPDQVIDTLNGDGGPIPFLCPTLAAPGGRVNPAPSIAVNNVSPNSGRVNVTNGDIRPSPGANKCSSPNGASSDGQWDVFVSSGLNTLPALNSGVSLTGGLGGDNFLPWTDADETTGGVATAFYKTSPDTTRQTALYATRPLNPAGGAPAGGITTLAAEASNYSGSLSTTFDYGDYNGIDAANGKIYPVWTDGRAGFPCCEILFRKVVSGSLSAETTLTSSSPEGALQGAESSVASAGSGDGTGILVAANNLNVGSPMLAFLSRNDGAFFTPLSLPTGASVPSQASVPAATSGPTLRTHDRRAPRLRLRLRRRQAIARRRAVVVRASCDERCTLSVGGKVRARRGSRRKLRKAVRTLEQGVEVTLKLRLSKRAIAEVSRALRRSRRPVATLTFKATDASGNASSARRRIALTR